MRPCACSTKCASYATRCSSRPSPASMTSAAQPSRPWSTWSEAWGARDLAEIEPEPFFDFTVQRPTVRLEGDERRIVWPIPRFSVASPEGSNRDFVLLSSAEPHLRWRTFTEIVAEVMEATGATTSITIAAQAAATPHTRPMPVTLSASHDDFEQQFGLEVPESRYEGPTGIVGVLNLSHRSRGWRNASLWAQAPHYLSTGPNPGAITALVEVLDRGFGLQTSLEAVEAQTADFDEQVRQALEESNEAADYIKNLEEQYDANQSAPSAAGRGRRRAAIRRGPAERPRRLPARPARRRVGRSVAGLCRLAGC